MVGRMTRGTSAGGARTIDVACLGRVAVDLYGEQRMTGLEQATSFRRYLGGSSGNLAVGVARLGLSSAMICRVGDDPMGRYLRSRLVAEGIDVRALSTDPSAKTALAFLGMLDAEAIGLDFYRERAADAHTRADDVPAGFLDQVDVLAITGTGLADPASADAVLAIAEAGLRAGCRLVLDVDYREALWHGFEDGLDGARERVGAIVSRATVLVGNEQEMQVLAGRRDTVAALAVLRERTSGALLVKLGAAGSTLLAGAPAPSESWQEPVPGRDVTVVNPVGAGDAFLAGFLARWLRGHPDRDCLAYANSAGALVVTRHGCSEAMAHADELEAFHGGRDADDAWLAHMHRCLSRRARPARITALACDHREPFECLMAEHGRTLEDARRFKGLVAKAAERVATERGEATGAMLMDPVFGSHVLRRLGQRHWWLGRPIEVSRSRPLRTEAGSALAADIATWNPAHVAKCLVWHHPDDDPHLQQRQIDTLCTLQAACRDAGVEWMLEAVPPLEIGHDDAVLARSVSGLYDAGLAPDWWKLPALASAQGWSALAGLIGERDPHCRGVVVLGLDRPLPELQAALRLAASQPLCAGFAIGRSVFGDAARAWFAGSLDDEGAVEDMRSRFSAIVATFTDPSVQPGAVPCKA